MADTFKIRADAAPLAKALALCSAIAKSARRFAPAQSVLMEAEGGTLTLRATNLDVALRLSLPCHVELPGQVLVLAPPIADAAKAMAKAKDAQIEFVADAETGRLTLMSGRTRNSFGLNKLDDFPALVGAWEAAESREGAAGDLADVTAPAECEGYAERRIGDDARKLLAKVLKHVGADQPALIERNEADSATPWARFVADGCAFAAALYAPDLFKAAPRSSFAYGMDSAAWKEAETYLRSLRAAHGLPLIGERLGDLIETEGRAVGMTFGEGRRDYNESRDAPEGWTPPADAEIIVSGVMQETTVDGVQFVRLGDKPWHWRYVAERPGEIVYPEGSYSLPMPADQRRPISAVTVEVDGIAQPVRCRFSGNCTGAIELTADEVAAMCGPVDPSTFVPIEAVAFHHGRAIARGADAERFIAMRDAFDRNARQALKNCRTTADKFLTAHNIGMDWRDRVAAFLESGGCAAETEAAERYAGAVEHARDTWPTIDESEGAAAARLGREREVPAMIADRGESAAARFLSAYDEQAAVFAGAVEPGASDPREETYTAAPATLEQVPAIETVAPMPAALERRLARLESALGLTDAPKRSPAHAAAIRRAWAMRRELRREQAERSRAWSVIVEERSARADLIGRLGRAERFAGEERAQLVAEIDAGRARLDDIAARLNRRLDDVERLEAAGRRIVRRAAVVRRDLARTRAERDGLAGNVQALSARIARDADALERLQPSSDRPRFILSSRLEA